MGWLVVYLHTPLKKNKVNGKDDIPYMMENKFMLQTTNQMGISLYLIIYPLVNIQNYETSPCC